MNERTKKTRTRKTSTGKVGKDASLAVNSEGDVLEAAGEAESVSAGETDSPAFIAQPDSSGFLPIPVMPRLESSADTEGDKLASRLKEMNRDIAWLLVGAGVAGIILPGLIGTPFFVVGVFALLPGSTARIERWRKKNSSSTALNVAMKQINRFLDDLEKRYPRQLR